MSFSDNKRLIAVIAVALGGVAIVAACSSDSSDAQPSRTVVPAGNGSTSSGGADDSGIVVGGTDQDAAVDPSCESDAGCFICDAGRSIDILNECTDDQCQPFDNTARLPLYVPGQALPPLPGH